jgi:hypothetical protein
MLPLQRVARIGRVPSENVTESHQTAARTNEPPFAALIVAVIEETQFTPFFPRCSIDGIAWHIV